MTVVHFNKAPMIAPQTMLTRKIPRQRLGVVLLYPCFVPGIIPDKKTVQALLH
jgi:hypothetical protein